MTPEFRLRAADWHADGSLLRKVRFEVFVLEQGVPEELEWDEFDATARHALAEDVAGHAIAVGRLLPDGHIGRLAVQPEWRRKKVGAALLEFLVADARRQGHRAIALNAQVHALAFYARYGFVACGAVFMEAGIPHQAMRRFLA